MTQLPIALQATPPPEKRIKLENAEFANNRDKDDNERKPVPLKEAHLNLDDIPPELLPKHQERLKKQARMLHGIILGVKYSLVGPTRNTIIAVLDQICTSNLMRVQFCYYYHLA